MPGHVTAAVPRSSPRSGCGGGPCKATRLIRLSKTRRIGASMAPRAPIAAAKWSRLSEQAIMIVNAVFVIPSRNSPRRDPMRQTFDRRSVLGLAVGSLAVGSAAGAMLVSSAKPTYAAGAAYKATLDGKSEVPPTTGSGTGTATVTYDPSTKMVTWEGSFSGLSGPATAAHIHGPAESGKNAG